MALPKSRMIFGQRWKIVVTDELPEHVMGLCQKEEKKLYISKKINKEDVLHTLIHEMCHALIHRISLDQALHHEMEEIIVDSFATMMTECFHISPKKQ